MHVSVWRSNQMWPHGADHWHLPGRGVLELDGWCQTHGKHSSFILEATPPSPWVKTIQKILVIQWQKENYTLIILIQTVSSLQMWAGCFIYGPKSHIYLLIINNKMTKIWIATVRQGLRKPITTNFPLSAWNFGGLYASGQVQPQSSL